MTKLTTKEAAEKVGCSARTIQNMIKKGKLSATRRDDESYIIDASEFYRVFPDAHDQRTVTQITETDSRTIMELELEHLKEIIKMQKEQIGFLHEQLEFHRIEKSVILDTFNNNQKLLENHSATTKKKKILGIF